MAELEEIGVKPIKSQRVLRATTRAAILRRLPDNRLQIAGALYMAQRGECFHCGGALPIFGHHLSEGSTTKEHALPKGVRLGIAQIDGACVLAHRLCNTERGERRLTSIEWQRASEVWAKAHEVWALGHRPGSLFPHWIELANHMVKETT